MNNETSNLKIVKAKVEQDNYEKAELNIIKADGNKILKDLYIEKEVDNGEFYVVSDNVLVALHRTLNEGEKPNLSLISNTGDTLIEGVYKSIIPIDDDMFICVKASSDMESVIINQENKTDPDKVEKISNDSNTIKEQMLNQIRNINPNYEENLKFVYEDAYNEAVVYKIDVIDSKYEKRVVSSEASFVAYDGLNLYTHSNVVTDITKVEIVGDNNMVENGEDTSMENNKVEEQVVTDTFDNIELNDLENNQELFAKYAPRPLEEIFNENNEDEGEEKVKTTLEENVNFDDFFAEESQELKEEEIEQIVESKEKEETFDTVEDEYEQLDNVVNKIIEEDKLKEERIKELEQTVEELSERLNKSELEVENKTKKVNTLINENRKYIDENRELNSKNEELENSLKEANVKNELLEDNVKELESAKSKLEEEAQEGKMKINAVISSLDNILNTHTEDVKQYVKER